jgi:hypothetical protein
VPAHAFTVSSGLAAFTAAWMLVQAAVAQEVSLPASLPDGDT